MIQLLNLEIFEFLNLEIFESFELFKNLLLYLFLFLYQYVKDRYLNYELLP
jgi:hypothetical protein